MTAKKQEAQQMIYMSQIYGILTSYYSRLTKKL
nr:unnamed protein product [Callosobruchus analis]